MSGDDARISHLMGEDSQGLDDRDRAELADLANLLADPSTWAMPPDELEARVVAAITAEAAATARVPEEVAAPEQFPAAEPVRAAVPPAAPDDVVDLARVRERRAPKGRWLAIGGAAAAAVLAVVAVGGALRSPDGSGPRFEVALAAVGAPGPSGSARLTRTDAGWEVVLDVSGLPRLDKGRYYQAWLRSTDGILVPLGSFNEGGRIILWSGVSPVDFPTFTVTVEAADGDQASSGVRVLAGTVDTSTPP